MRRIRPIQAAPLEEHDRRLRERGLNEQTFGIVGSSRADSNQSRYVGEPLLTGIGVTECAASRATVGDGTTTPRAGFHTQQHRAVPVAERLVIDAGGEPDSLGSGLMI